MTRRDRQALRLGGVAILAALVGFRGVPRAWAFVSRTHQRLIAEQELLARAESDLRSLATLEDSAERLKEKVVGLAPQLLSGATASEAVAGLSGHLGHLALTHNARLDRTDPVPDSVGVGDLRRVTLDAVFETDVRGLVGLLGGLAAGQPVTEVSRLRVSTNDPAASPRSVEVLRIEVRVQAWYLDREVS